MNTQHVGSRHVVLVLLGVMVLVLLVRAARVIHLSDVGPGALQWQWHDAVFAKFSHPYRSLADQPLADRARYWLREADRAKTADPPDAERLMGAALTLDALLREEMLHRDRWTGVVINGRPVRTGTVFRGPMESSDVDENGLDAVQLQQCLEGCLDLARSATEAMPENKELWRLRAQLLFQSGRRPHYWSTEFTPRVANWEEQLEECSRHDPENALYKYLAYRAAASGTWSRPAGDRSAQHLQEAQAKSTLALGEARLVCFSRFVSSAQLNRLHRYLVLRRYWPQHRAYDTPEVELYENLWVSLAAGGQYGISSSHAIGNADLWRLAYQFRRYADPDFATMTEGEDGPWEETNSLGQQAYQAELAERRTATASRRAAWERTRQQNTVEAKWVWIALEVPKVLPLVFLLSLSCASAARFLKKGAGNRPPLWPQFVLGGLAIAISIGWFGWAPARLEVKIQSRLATGLILLAIAVLLVKVGWKSWGQRGFQFQLATLLVLVLVTGVGISVAQAAQIKPEHFLGFPFCLWLPWRYPDPDYWGPFRIFMSDIHEQGSVMLQWSLYRGPLAAVALHGTLVTLWFMWWRRRRSRRRIPEFAAPSTRSWMAGWMDTLARGFFTASVLILVVYLGTLPWALETIENDWRQLQESISVEEG